MKKSITVLLFYLFIQNSYSQDAPATARALSCGSVEEEIV